MKKIAIAATSLGVLAGCSGIDKKSPDPQGFVLEHVAIDVADPVATAAWWCENLGFTITKQKDDITHTTFIVDASGRMAIEIYRAKTQPVAPDYAALTKAGATLVFHEKAPGFDGAMMRDPSGIAIQFVKRDESVLLK